MPTTSRSPNRPAGPPLRPAAGRASSAGHSGNWMPRPTAGSPATHGTICGWTCWTIAPGSAPARTSTGRKTSWLTSISSRVPLWSTACLWNSTWIVTARSFRSTLTRSPNSARPSISTASPGATPIRPKPRGRSNVAPILARPPACVAAADRPRWPCARRHPTSARGHQRRHPGHSLPTSQRQGHLPRSRTQSRRTPHRLAPSPRRLVQSNFARTHLSNFEIFTPRRDFPFAAAGFAA